MRISPRDRQFSKQAVAYAQSVVHDLPAEREAVCEFVSASETYVPSVIQSPVQRAHQGRKSRAYIGGPLMFFLLRRRNSGKWRQQRCRSHASDYVSPNLFEHRLVLEHRL